jgi:hypothetical protein
MAALTAVPHSSLWCTWASAVAEVCQLGNRRVNTAGSPFFQYPLVRPPARSTSSSNALIRTSRVWLHEQELFFCTDDKYSSHTS